MSGNSAPVPSLTLTTFETMVDQFPPKTRPRFHKAPATQPQPDLSFSPAWLIEKATHRRRTTHSTNQTFPSPAWQVADHNYASPCVPRPRSACDFRCGPHAREEAAYEPRARKTRHAGAGAPRTRMRLARAGKKSFGPLRPPRRPSVLAARGVRSQSQRAWVRDCV